MLYYAVPGLVKNSFIPIKLTQNIRHQYAMQILETVAAFYNEPMKRVTQKIKSSELVTIRQVASYIILDKIPKMSLKEVASLFGDRYLNEKGYDHSAIIYNDNKVKELIETGDSVIEDIKLINQILVGINSKGYCYTVKPIKQKIKQSEPKRPGRKIKCINNGVIYQSIAEAAKDLNYSSCSICNLLKGTRKISKRGLKFIDVVDG